jgi:predicted Na+-dependent transporter
LVLLIFLPYSVGYFVNYRGLRFVNKSSNFLDKLLKLYVLVITFTGPFELRDPLIKYFSESILLVVSSIISIYLIQKLSSKLVKISKDNDRTILIEALCQNFPIVLTLSIILKIPEMAIFGIIYYLVTLLVVVPFSLIRN